MSTENIQPDVNVEPTVEADVSSELDSDEAEYQAEMAKIKGEASGEEEEETSEADEDEDEEEYRKELEKARGKKEEKAAKKEAAPKKEESSDKKIWKFKVNGKEVEFDGSNEEAVKSKIQLGLAANEKFEAAAKIKDQALNLLKNMREDLGSIIEHPDLGLDPQKVREFCENYLYKHIKKDMLTPEERQRQANDEELERRRADDKRREESNRARQKEELKNRYRQEWDQKFTEALSTSGLPKTDWTVTRMAHYMKIAIQKGYAHIQPSDVVEHVKNDWLNAQKQTLAHLDGEKLVEMLGKETVDKIRKATVKKYEDTRFSNGNGVTTHGRREDTAKPKKVYSSTDEMMRAIRR